MSGSIYDLRARYTHVHVAHTHSYVAMYMTKKQAHANKSG